MSVNNSVAGGETLRFKFNERFIMVQLLVLIFLCINLSLIVTLFSRVHFFLTTTRYVLFALTLLSDSLILTMSDILLILNHFNIRMYLAFCVIIYILVVLFTFVTPVTLTAMTLERYVAICMPLRHGELCSARNTVYVILIIHGLGSVPIIVILSVFFASAPHSLYMQYRICAMDIFVFLRWQNNVKLAVYQWYFVTMAVTISFSYIQIMKVANVASGENKKSTWKGLRTVALHAFQLLLCLIQLWCPFIETAVFKIDIRLFINVRYFNYLMFYLAPRCLSPLIYGLRDENVFFTLKQIATFGIYFRKINVRINSI